MSEENRDDRESREYDVVIVGAGPAGLSCSIRLKQLAAENDKELSVCIIEKGAEVGSHLLSGAVLETRALNELIPDWKTKGAPLNIDKFNLRQNSSPQTYALGVKEIWEIDKAKHTPGHVSHSIGWPLPNDVYGGSFIYHAADNLIYLG